MPGINGSVYGIPGSGAGRVVKFNSVEKSKLTSDLISVMDASDGAMTENCVIPLDDSRGILKIDTNTDNVTELD